MTDSYMMPRLSLWEATQRERGLALRAALAPTLENVSAFELQAARTSLALERLAPTGEAPATALLPAAFFEALSLRHNEPFAGNRRPSSLFDFYTERMEHPLLQILTADLADRPDLRPAQASAIVHGTLELFWIAQTRDIGLCIYADGQADPAAGRKLIAAARAGRAQERLFLSLADGGLKQAALWGEGVTPHEGQTASDLLRRLSTAHGKATLSELTPGAWFDLFDRMLTHRHAALREGLAHLARESAELSVLGPASGQGLDSEIEHAMESIASLPLFRGLGESALRSLLRGARFLDLDKNQSFMTQGEPVSRFFIVMDGWVKLVKTSADGEEATLHIAKRKEPVLDVPSLAPGLAGISAKTVGRARVLAISLPALRDVAARSSALTGNLLAATTERLHGLLGHMEQITVRSAAQRVGWFLVNLYVETGLEGEPIALPFDKALIAAYLHIKPETFSRVLQQFREKGFIIDKHKVVLPGPDALCAFCDPELSTRCCRAEAADCAPIRQARRIGGG